MEVFHHRASFRPIAKFVFPLILELKTNALLAPRSLVFLFILLLAVGQVSLRYQFLIA